LNIVNMTLCQIIGNTICCGRNLRCFFQIPPAKNQISVDARFGVRSKRIMLDKILITAINGTHKPHGFLASA
jgi:hypothetical protein